MITREEALAFLNEVIEDNHGTAVTEDVAVLDIDIDSFGFAVLFLELEEEFDCDLGKLEKTEELKGLTVKELLDRVEECS